MSIKKGWTREEFLKAMGRKDSEPISINHWNNDADKKIKEELEKIVEKKDNDIEELFGGLIDVK